MTDAPTGWPDLQRAAAAWQPAAPTRGIVATALPSAEKGSQTARHHEGYMRVGGGGRPSCARSCADAAQEAAQTLRKKLRRRCAESELR